MEALINVCDFRAAAHLKILLWSSYRPSSCCSLAVVSQGKMGSPAGPINLCASATTTQSSGLSLSQRYVSCPWKCRQFVSGLATVTSNCCGLRCRSVGALERSP